MPETATDTPPCIWLQIEVRPFCTTEPPLVAQDRRLTPVKNTPQVTHRPFRPC